MSIKQVSKLIVGLNFIWIFFSQPVFSQQASAEKNEPEQPIKQTPQPKKGSDSTFRLGEVQVKSSKKGKISTKDVLTSVDVVGKSLIQNQNVNYVWELFNLIPGALLTNFNQGNTNGKFSFRGFNGEGEINAVKLLIDGIPSNTNDGNMPFIDALFPLNIESIETVRGTNDPRYGLYNIAGNANITTTLGGTYAKGRVNHGSFNTTDIQAGAGMKKMVSCRTIS